MLFAGKLRSSVIRGDFIIKRIWNNDDPVVSFYVTFSGTRIIHVFLVFVYIGL